jgi:DNA invertase Pin-like site-specific DNA recombinase
MRHSCTNCAVLAKEIARLRTDRRVWHMTSMRNHVIALYKQGLSAVRIQEQTGISKGTVFNWVRAEGLSRRRKKNPHYAQGLREALRMVERGHTMKAAAAAHDIGYCTVRRYCEEKGITSRYLRQRGDVVGLVGQRIILDPEVSR